MPSPTQERSPHDVPTAQPRRPSLPWLITSSLLLAIWATALALMAFRIL